MRSFVSLSLLLAAAVAVGCSNKIDFDDRGGAETGEPLAPSDDGSDDGTPDDTGEEPGTDGSLGNQAPIADAGPDFDDAEAGRPLELDASGSSDPDGDILNFFWEIVDAPADSTAFIINEDRLIADIIPTHEGLYVIRLTVDDNDLSSTDDVEIDVVALNEGPIAQAGPDQVVTVGDRVDLNGANSYDPDGDRPFYSWSLQRPGGSNASLDDSNSATPSFVADVAGIYIAELVVNDGRLDSEPDTVRINAQPASSGGGGGGDCLSCAAREADRRFSTGRAAGTLGLVFLPLVVAAFRRRRQN